MFVNNSLEKKTRVQLINYLADLIHDEYEDTATQMEIGYICTAAVELFPSLRDENGGIVCMIENIIILNIGLHSFISLIKIYHFTDDFIWFPLWIFVRKFAQ